MEHFFNTGDGTTYSSVIGKWGEKWVYYSLANVSHVYEEEERPQSSTLWYSADYVNFWYVAIHRDWLDPSCEKVVPRYTWFCEVGCGGQNVEGFLQSRATQHLHFSPLPGSVLPNHSRPELSLDRQNFPLLTPRWLALCRLWSSMLAMVLSLVHFSKGLSLFQLLL